ncbi:carcinoembryonic antigen-related cell adhesion molecule 1-like isoform X2 [Mercenaria mercenaria]|uniref:carcinoembryonic antigen-related cell adhesion molecule 1-like isoform X2 n=1 Tax=Mercenaria mercenaria TaxID=6596 RepID=UPI00234EF686|nr:carcinoembryonic antigen-related cell adhesion molecule 1-like isoform X2 [Mercenaria mercenaria]
MRCEVKNPQFPNLELVQLYRPNITYAPIITVSGQDNGVAYLGDDVFLTCHVDSNPPSTLSWYNQTHLIKELYGAKNFDLQLVNISFDHSQTYTCVAHNSIGSIKSKNVTLVVKDSESQTNCGSLTVEANNLAEEHTAILQFSIHPGRPIKWAKKINSTFQQLFKGNKYEFTKNDEKTIHNLLIFLSKYSDSGEYRVNCDTAVSNSVHLYIATGSSSLSFVVPVVVGCTVVVVTAVIAVIVFVTCLKRRQNAQVEMKETDQRSTGPGRNAALYVNTDQQQYESVLSTTDREETHTYSKLGADDEKTNLQSQGEVSLVLAELDLKQNSDNTVRKPLSLPDEQNNESHYVNAKQPVYEELEQKLDKEETHYSKLATD